MVGIDEDGVCIGVDVRGRMFWHWGVRYERWLVLMKLMREKVGEGIGGSICYHGLCFREMFARLAAGRVRTGFL